MIPTELTDPETGEYKLPWYEFLKAHDPELFAALREWQKAATLHKALSAKTHELIVVAIDSFISWPSPYIDVHIHGAFNQGATVQEVLEAMAIAALFGHTLHHGLTAMGKTIRERTMAGAPTPRHRGGEDLLIPPERRDPATGPYKLPWEELFEENDPELFAALRTWQHRARQHKELDAKTHELIIIAIESLVRADVKWPSPFLDVHISEALDNGASIQEIIEAMAIASQFGHALNHGITALAKTIRDRTAAGMSTPGLKENG